MRRVLLGGLLAIVLAATAQAGAGGGNACGPANARTLASSPRARVYALRKAVYGCAGKTRYRLGSVPSPQVDDYVSRVVVAGRLAAYASGYKGYDFTSATVVVRNLADGKQLFNSPALSNPQATGETTQSVDSLVVRPDGNVAWIAKWQFYSPPIGVEVHRRKGMLDHGRTIRSGSLKLHGSLLSWKHGSRTRHAKLL
jgi:hypothetical protein